MRVCFFEDDKASQLEPLTFTRAVFDLRSGCTTLQAKQRRLIPGTEFGAIVRPNLASISAERHPQWKINDLDWITENPVVLVHSRWLPDVHSLSLDPSRFTASRSFVALAEGEIAFAYITPDQWENESFFRVEEWLLRWKQSLPSVNVPGQWIHHLWDLLAANAEQIEIDFHWHRKSGTPCGRPGTLTLQGPSDWLYVDPTARIDPFVIADTSNGPILIDRDVVVTSFTRLEGPCYIGPRTTVSRGLVSQGTSIGPNSRIGGEVQGSILQGHADKPHDGLLALSYLGEWTTIGAGSQTQIERLDRQEIVSFLQGVETATGQQQLGLLMGDHAHSAVGTFFSPGASLGAFSQVDRTLAAQSVEIPPFCEWSESLLSDQLSFAQHLEAAKKMWISRGEEPSETRTQAYQHLFDRGTAFRKSMVQRHLRERLRRAA